MFSRIFSSCLIACLAITLQVSAKEIKPIDRFIEQIKETHTLTAVNNLWHSHQDDALQARILKQVSAAKQLDIDFANLSALVRNKPFAIDLEVPSINGGAPYHIELGRYDYFTNDFQIVAHQDGKKDTKVDYTPGVYYSGVVKDIPGSIVAFSFFNEEVYGIFSIPGEGNFVLVPNTMVGNSFGNQHYILYNDKDILDKTNAPGCTADQLPEMDSWSAAAKTTTLVNAKTYRNCSNVTIFELADFATYTSKGRSTTAVANFATAHFNNMATLYRNEHVMMAQKYIQINTATDQYQTLPASSIRWLAKFGYYTKDTLHGANLALMLTTKHGTMGGVAWLRQLCGSYSTRDSSGPYAFANIDNGAVVNFPTYSWNVEVTTHELGHSLGSPHTHRCCWNPTGTGRTAIDGCYTLEGTCANPGRPTAGGTIMSYCHLVSTGINFSNGFGPQPGDTIRYFVRTNTCDTVFKPTTVISTANRMITANRECTDIATSMTYFWHDNNTADHADDTLVLMMQKGANNIGTLDTAGFTVASGTTASYGSNTGLAITFPTGTLGLLPTNTGIRRYWKVTAPRVATSNVEVIFPFTKVDSSDVDGTVAGLALSPAKYSAYKTTGTVDPNPTLGFTGGTASNFTILSNGTMASATNWALERIGNNYFAHMVMTNVSGGGSLFYTYKWGVGVHGVLNNSDLISIYPNPTKTQWNLVLSSQCVGTTIFNLYSVDGRFLKAQTLDNSKENIIDASELPNGLYFYKVVNAQQIFSGTLMKD